MHNDRDDLRIVSWNAQGANMETDRIQDAVQQDSIDVLMLQDTHYMEPQDNLPPLLLRGYHTYHHAATYQSREWGCGMSWTADHGV